MENNITLDKIKKLFNIIWVKGDEGLGYYIADNLEDRIAKKRTELWDLYEDNKQYL